MRRAWVSLVVFAACAGAGNQKPSAAQHELQPPVAARRPHAVVSPHGSRERSLLLAARRQPVAQGGARPSARRERLLRGDVEPPSEPLTDKLTAELVSRERQDDRTRAHTPTRTTSTDRATRPARSIRSGFAGRITARSGGSGAAARRRRNVESRGHEYYSLAAAAVSPAQDLLAFSEDTGGPLSVHAAVPRDRDRARPARSHRRLEPGVAWADDNRTVFYVENDPTTLLSKRVRRHRLGTDPALDPVVYEEKDEPVLPLGLHLTADERFVLISLDSTSATEYHALPRGRRTRRELALPGAARARAFSTRPTTPAGAG